MVRSAAHRRLALMSRKAAEMRVERRRQEEESRRVEQRQRERNAVTALVRCLQSDLDEEREKNSLLEAEIERLREVCSSLRSPKLPEEPSFQPGSTYCDKMKMMAARIIKFSLPFFRVELGMITPVWIILEKMTGINRRTLRSIWRNYNGLNIVPVCVENGSSACKLPPCKPAAASIKFEADKKRRRTSMNLMN